MPSTKNLLALSRLALPTCLMVIAATLLIACQRPAVPRPDGATTELLISLNAERYTVDPAASRVMIHVYRAGRLARLGHNHIISSADLRGEVYIDPENLSNSVFLLNLPVETLEVDRGDLRALAGEDFAAEVDDGAKAGTRENMLGEQQLNAALWPEITVRGTGLNGALPSLSLNIEFEVQSRRHTMTIPVAVEMDGAGLRAVGEFPVLQTELGLAPFSIMLGAIAVRDQLDISFEIVANKAF